MMRPGGLLRGRARLGSARPRPGGCHPCGDGAPVGDRTASAARPIWRCAASPSG